MKRETQVSRKPPVQPVSEFRVLVTEIRSVQFAEFIQANIQLYSMRNDTELSPSAVSSFVRGELARSLRSRDSYLVNLLLGGVDPITQKPSLYWLDYLAALAPVPYAAHGYAQYVVTSKLGRLFITDCDFKVLLPIDTRQAPSSGHYLRAGLEAS